MKYMLLIYTNPETWPTDPAEQQAVHEAYMTFTEKILASGEMAGGDQLAPTESATTVRVRDGRTGASDGPFAETKELLGGYYIVDVPDLDRAIELAGQIPDAATGSIEVRPIVDMSAPA